VYFAELYRLNSNSTSLGTIANTTFFIFAHENARFLRIFPGAARQIEFAFRLC